MPSPPTCGSLAASSRSVVLLLVGTVLSRLGFPSFDFDWELLRGLLGSVELVPACAAFVWELLRALLGTAELAITSEVLLLLLRGLLGTAMLILLLRSTPRFVLLVGVGVELVVAPLSVLPELSASKGETPRRERGVWCGLEPEADPVRRTPRLPPTEEGDVFLSPCETTKTRSDDILRRLLRRGLSLRARLLPELGFCGVDAVTGAGSDSRFASVAFSLRLDGFFSSLPAVRVDPGFIDLVEVFRDSLLTLRLDEGSPPAAPDTKPFRSSETLRVDREEDGVEDSRGVRVECLPTDFELLSFSATLVVRDNFLLRGGDSDLCCCLTGSGGTWIAEADRRGRWAVVGALE